MRNFFTLTACAVHNATSQGRKKLLIKQTMDIRHITGCKAVSLSGLTLYSTQFPLLLVIWLPTFLTFLPRTLFNYKQLHDNLFAPLLPFISLCDWALKMYQYLTYFISSNSVFSHRFASPTFIPSLLLTWACQASSALCILSICSIGCCLAWAVSSSALHKKKMMMKTRKEGRHRRGKEGVEVEE